MSLATAGSSVVKIWEVDLARSDFIPQSSIGPLESSGRNDIFRRLSWSPSGLVLAEAATDSNLVRLLRTGQLKQVSVLEVPSLVTGVSSISFSPNSRLLAASSGGDTFVWDFKRCQFKHSFSDRFSPTICALFLSQSCLLIASRNRSLRAHNLLQQDAFLEFERGAVNDAFLTCATSSPDKVVAGFGQGSVSIWDADCGRLIQDRQFHAGGVDCAEFSPRNPRLVMTGGADGSIALVDTATSSGRPSARIDNVGTHSLSFHPDAVHFAVGLRSGELRLYDWRNARSPCVRAHADSNDGGVEVKFLQGKEMTGTRSPDSVATLSTSEDERRADAAVLITHPPKIKMPKALSLDASNEIASRDLYESVTDDEVSKSEMDTLDTQKILRVVQTQSTKLNYLRHTTNKKSTDESNQKLPFEKSLEMIKSAVKPVSAQELDEALTMLRYDVHRDIQEIIREQVRQFELAKVVSPLSARSVANYSL